MKIIKNISNVFVYIAIGGLVAMLAITLIDILGRLLFAKPLVGATEVCEILMVVLLTAMGGSLIAGKTTQVDVLMDILPKKISVKIDTGVMLATIAFCFMIGWSTFRNGQYSMDTGRMYTFLKIPQWPFVMLLAFSFIVAGFVGFFFLKTLYEGTDKEKSVLGDPELAILMEEINDEL